MLQRLPITQPVRRAMLAAWCLGTVGLSGAWAATTTSSFNVTLTITASCSISSPGTLNFGSVGVLAANVNASSVITVQCTNTTPYNIGLDAGATAGATTTVRLMANGATTVSYRLYSDASRTTNWGNQVGTDTVAATGTGVAQLHTVYGQVPVQTSPAPGTYSDTITVTVTY